MTNEGFDFCLILALVWSSGIQVINIVQIHMAGWIELNCNKYTNISIRWKYFLRWLLLNYTLFQKKCKMDSLIFPGAQGHGPVALCPVECAPWSFKTTVLVWHDAGLHDLGPGLQKKQMNPFYLSFVKDCVSEVHVCQRSGVLPHISCNFVNFYFVCYTRSNTSLESDCERFSLNSQISAYQFLIRF